MSHLDEIIEKRAHCLNHKMHRITRCLMELDPSDMDARMLLKRHEITLNRYKMSVSHPIVTQRNRVLYDQATKRCEELRGQISCRRGSKTRLAMSQPKPIQSGYDPSHQDTENMITLCHVPVPFTDDPRYKDEVKTILMLYLETVKEKINCSICLTTAKEASVTQCGHHFCKSCLYRACPIWALCPVCREPLGRWWPLCTVSHGARVQFNSRKSGLTRRFMLISIAIPNKRELYYTILCYISIQLLTHIRFSSCELVSERNY